MTFPRDPIRSIPCPFYSFSAVTLDSEKKEEEERRGYKNWLFGTLEEKREGRRRCEKIQKKWREKKAKKITPRPKDATRVARIKPKRDPRPSKASKAIRSNPLKMKTQCGGRSLIFGYLPFPEQTGISAMVALSFSSLKHTQAHEKDKEKPTLQGKEKDGDYQHKIVALNGNNSDKNEASRTKTKTNKK